MPADHEELILKAESMNLPVQDVAVEGFHNTEDVYLFPAGMEQHRYWILDQVDKASTASNMAITWRLVGTVDEMLVEKSICALSLRHEALRTTFRMIDGDLNQVISEKPLYGFSVSDLRSIAEEERPARAERLLLDHSHVPLDLATGPLFSARLVHVSDSEHFLACTMHHIVCDGWSNGILVRDFAEFYSAYTRDRSPELPELPFQFADFTVWQKDWLATAAAEEALNFWREQIQIGASAVDLPTDYPRTARKDGPGSIASQLMPQSLNERLKQFCRRHEATNHQVLLAVFQGLISRYTGQEKFLLGSSIANRTQPGMDNIVGRFANPQVILADVTDNPRFGDLLHRVTKWSTLAYAHQDLPFSRLMEEFQFDQSGATSQFLQIYFVYQKAFMQPQQAGGMEIVPRPSVSGGVNFDLLVSIVERAEGPRLQIEYNTDLFRRERIQNFIQQYIRVLDAVLENPSMNVSQLPLLSTEEESAFRQAGHGNPLSQHVPSSLIEAFDYHAARLDAFPAIITRNERTSWKALADKSIQFAQSLLDLNVSAGEVVAVRMEANADAVATVLALLRIGGIVLPVPAGTSIHQWNRILSEIQPALALGSVDFCSNLPSAVSFDALRAKAQRKDALPSIDAKAAAWVGLAIDSSDHYQVHAFSNEISTVSLAAASQVLELMPGDRVAVKLSPVSIDALVDLALPLISGASILYLDEASSDQLQLVIDREQVGFAFATATEWLELLNHGWSGDRRVNIVCRGSHISESAKHRLLPVGRAWSLISSALVGGPISMVSLHQESEATNPAAPLPGQCFTILDTWNNPVPDGVLGELTVSNGGELKRTGFLAQHDSRHRFEIVDRAQNLVSLQRSRLRLGELEDRLLGMSGIAHAKAAICKDANNNPTLTAFISGANGTQFSLGDVSRSLRSTAPGHLASANLLPVEVMILRPDGTPDTEALRTLNTSSEIPAPSDDYVPPRDEIESKLVSIWEDVIGVKRISIRASFFSLGGYSLMIVRLFARINKAMNTSLPLTTIFNAPTIEQLADILRGRQAYSSIVPVKTTGNKSPFFMIISYLLYGSLPGALGDDYPFYGLRELDNEQEMTLEERAASFVKAIRSVQSEGPYYLGGWCAAGPLTIEVGRQLMECGHKLALTVLFDAWHPGYAQQQKQELKASGITTHSARLRQRCAFHRGKLRNQTIANQFAYLKTVAVNKLRLMRDSLYLKHYAITAKIAKAFGMPLPDFMHNVTETTMIAMQRYEPLPFHGNMMLIRATNAPTLPGADAACGWAQVVKGNIDVVWVPGDHETMFMEPNLESVGKTLRDGLERATNNA